MPGPAGLDAAHGIGSFGLKIILAIAAATLAVICGCVICFRAQADYADAALQYRCPQVCFACTFITWFFLMEPNR